MCVCVCVIVIITADELSMSLVLSPFPFLDDASPFLSPFIGSQFLPHSPALQSVLRLLFPLSISFLSFAPTLPHCLHRHQVLMLSRISPGASLHRRRCRSLWQSPGIRENWHKSFLPLLQSVLLDCCAVLVVADAAVVCMKGSVNREHGQVVCVWTSCGAAVMISGCHLL